MNHQQQPATAISIKASLVATNENRFIALPSPLFFNLLIEKIAAVFNLSTDEVAVVNVVGAVGTGRCIGALRRADGDVDAAKADLVDWCAKRQEHKRNKPNGKTTAASSADDKAADRIKRRNERLLKKFNGDVVQVAGLLEARKAKVEARIAARKARQAERPRCKRAAHPTEEPVASASTAC